MTRPLRNLEPTLAAQQNAVGRWQMDPSQVRAALRAVDRKEWQKPTRHVFVAGRAELTDDVRVWVAVLHGGRDARLAGRTALTLHGWKEPQSSPIDIVTPRNVTRSKTPIWIRIHRTNRLTGPAQDPPRVDVHAAVIQSANWAASDRAAMFIVLSCLQQGLVSAHRIMEQSSGLRRGLITDLAQEFLTGVTSVNEFDFLMLCRHWGLPEPIRQSRVYDASGKVRAIDAEFRLRDGQRRHVEIEGMHHFEPSNFLADLTRHNELIVQGAACLRVLSYTLKYEPATLRPQLERWLTCGDLPTT